MSLKIARPKNLIVLVAGLVGLFFDRVSGQPVPDPAAADESVQSQRDDLTKISGIGPAFARRLNEAGVTTYSELADLSPDQVREMAQVAEWQGDPAQWIAQAKTMA